LERRGSNPSGSEATSVWCPFLKQSVRTSMQIDEVEIKGFLERLFVDWAGKICSVLFLPNCNFRCPYCHNYSLVLQPEQYPRSPWTRLLNRPRRSPGLGGWGLPDGRRTYVARRSSSLDPSNPRTRVSVKLDTNGSNPQMLEALLEAGEIDFVAMDVKAPLDSFSYRRSAGRTIDLTLIQRSIGLLKMGKDTL